MLPIIPPVDPANYSDDERKAAAVMTEAARQVVHRLGLYPIQDATGVWGFQPVDEKTRERVETAFTLQVLQHGGYEPLRTALESLPTTWYPDLIRAMVEAAYKKKVFKPAGASHFVHNVERRMVEARRREKGKR